MIRLSVGLESLDDILWDIDQALEQARSDDALRRSAVAVGRPARCARARSAQELAVAHARRPAVARADARIASR